MSRVSFRGPFIAVMVAWFLRADLERSFQKVVLEKTKKHDVIFWAQKANCARQLWALIFLPQAPLVLFSMLRSGGVPWSAPSRRYTLLGSTKGNIIGE